MPYILPILPLQFTEDDIVNLHADCTCISILVGDTVGMKNDGEVPLHLHTIPSGFVFTIPCIPTQLVDGVEFKCFGYHSVKSNEDDTHSVHNSNTFFPF